MKLTPCPFCGGSHIKTRRLSEMLACPPAELNFYKHCENCDACGPLGFRPTSAGALWNDRIADPDLSDIAGYRATSSPNSGRSSP
jgi:Lar family restriction alleviation protein